ncbi:MAG: hypothetical protein NVS1B13_01660 [Flavisolibacter sp.]
MSVTPFARLTGILWLQTPNISHINVPNVKIEYMDAEIADVSLVRIVFKACGKKDIVVQKAAKKPAAVIQFI